MKVMARISGLVTYSNGYTQSFAAHLDDQGNVSYNNLTENVEATYHVTNDQNWLENMLALLGTMAVTPASSSNRNVSNFVGEISGRVALDNQTWGDFIAQYNSQVGAFLPTGGSVTYWTTAIANSTILASLTDMLEGIAGSGAASITP